MSNETKLAIDAYAAREGVTYTEVAKRLGVTPPTVSNIRRGKFKPSLALARRMRDLFGLSSLDEIFGAHTEPTTEPPTPTPEQPEASC